MGVGGIVIFISAGFLIIAGIIVAFALYKKGTDMNVERYRLSWIKLERQLDKDDAASCARAVMDADRLIGEALKDKGAPGEAMDEQIDNLSEQFSGYSSLLQVRRISDQLSQATTAGLSYADARRVLAVYKQALKDLGAI